MQTLHLKMLDLSILRDCSRAMVDREAVDMYCLPVTMGNSKSSLPHYSPSSGDRAWWARE